MPHLVIVSLALLITAVSCGKDSEYFGEAERKKVHAAQDAPEKQVKELSKKRLEGVRALAEKNGPVMGSKAPCPVDLQGQLDDMDEAIKGKLVPSEPFEVTTIDGLEKKVERHRSARMRPRIHMHNGEMRTAKKTEMEKYLALAKEQSTPAYWGTRSTIIVDSRREAEVVGDLGAGKGGTMKPGTIVGRMFVWDFAKSAVVCVAPVIAQSSSQVKVLYSKIDTNIGKATSVSGLAQDLDRQAFRAAVPKAVAVGDASVPYPVTITDLGKGVASVANATGATTPAMTAALAIEKKACACKERACALGVDMPKPTDRIKGTLAQQRVAFMAHYNAARCLWKAGLLPPQKVSWTEWVVQKSQVDKAARGH